MNAPKQQLLLHCMLRHIVGRREAIADTERKLYGTQVADGYVKDTRGIKQQQYCCSSLRHTKHEAVSGMLFSHPMRCRRRRQTPAREGQRSAL